MSWFDTTLGWVTEKGKTNRTAFVFLLLTITLRTIYLIYSDNGFNGDCSTRLYFCYWWIHSPSIMVGYDWLPLHFYLLGIPMFFSQEVVWTPRIVTVIFGVLSVFPFAALLRKVFEERVVLYSLLIFALLPAHIVLSVITLSEVPFIFFLLCALNYAFRFLNSNTTKDLVLTILFLSMANFIRFEGWMFSFLLFLVFWNARVSYTRLLTYLSGLAPLILYVLIMSWKKMGDPFWGLNESDRFVINSLKDINPIDNGIEIMNAFPALSVILLPLGIFFYHKNVFVKRYLFLLSVPLLYTLFKIFSCSLTGQYRYLITSSILSIPFIALTIQQMAIVIFRNDEKKRSVLIYMVCILICIVPYQKVLWDPIQPGSNGKFAPGYIASALWVKSNLPNSKLLLDTDFFSTYTWMVYADKISMYNCTTEKSWALERYPDIWKDSNAISTSFYAMIKANHVTHLVLFKNGNISTHLHFRNKLETINDLHFDRIYDYNGYSVYKVF